MDLVARQSKVQATQLTKPSFYMTVYFDRLPDSSGVKFHTVGDQVWPENPPIGTTDEYDKQEDRFRQAGRARLVKSKEEQLNERIQALPKNFQDLVDVRDIPGKREELFDKVRDP